MLLRNADEAGPARPGRTRPGDSITLRYQCGRALAAADT
jgi:hypothetical protein